MKFDDWDAYFSSLIGDDLLQVPGLASWSIMKAGRCTALRAVFAGFSPSLCR